MNQLCKVCGEPAAGFHFGAFTCEGCKSFFGRTYNNISAISGCKNSGDCVINKKNRTACKACRLRKCLLVGMSKSGSRYGRRSNWFKIHCLLQEQQSNHTEHNNQIELSRNSNLPKFTPQQLQAAKQTYQDKQNEAIKTANMKSSSILLNPFLPPQLLNGTHHMTKYDSPSDDSGASSAAPEDSLTNGVPHSPTEKFINILKTDRTECLSLFPNETNYKADPIRNHFAAVAFQNLQLPQILTGRHAHQTQSETNSLDVQDEPIDLSVKTKEQQCRILSPVASIEPIEKKTTPLDLTIINQYHQVL